MDIIHDTFLDKFIGEKLQEQNAKERSEHKPSGKLSASMLGSPLQWQILKAKGIAPKPIDEYTIRKFKRGKDVEDWFMGFIPAVERQRFIEYRGVVGFVDAIVDTSEWAHKIGAIPLEIKSVTNLAYKKIMQEGAKRGHKLQAGCYALALGTDHFAVSYVASDDYRVLTYICETAEVKKNVDDIITKYDEQLKTGLVPIFEAVEKFWSMPIYNNYPDYTELTQEEINEKVDNQTQ